jgi:hypothetical protein
MGQFQPVEYLIKVVCPLEQINRIFTDFVYQDLIEREPWALLRW